MKKYLFLFLVMLSRTACAQSSPTFQCVAPGTATITAQNGGLTGSVTLTCSNQSSVSLLPGCTVSATNTINFGSGGCPASLPSGWTLAFADGFETSQPARKAFTGSTHITNSFAHTGASSMTGFYNGDSAEVSEYYGGSALDGASGYHELYVSMWDYVDPNALFGNSDYNFMFVLGPNAADCGFLGDSIDGEQPNIGVNNVSATSTVFNATGTALPPSCPGSIFFNQSFTLSMNAGFWRQYEWHIVPSTSFTPPQQFPPPNCNSLSPSSAGCGNGSMQFYVNGALVYNVLNANLNGTAVISPGGRLKVGGFITSFSATGARCTVFSLTGGGTCPGTQPGTGGPQPFNRFIDDVIVMKK